MGSRVGIQIAGTTPPAEVAAIAAAAEQLGYGELWLAEDYFDLGGIASTAIALAATRDIPVGLGVVSVRARHPAVTAMEFATLGGAFPGRFMAGIGHGATAWLEQMGLVPGSPLRPLAEGSQAVRRLLDGEELSEDGQSARFREVRLRFPPAEDAPLYFGVHGPRSLELAGEVADGTLLGWFSSPDYVAWARERIDEGRARAGRTGDHALVALCVLSISDDDPDAARAQLAERASWFLSGMSGQPQMGATASGRELAAALQTRPSDEPVLPADLLDGFMAAGDTAACEAFIDRLLDAGADRVVLVPNPAGVRSTEAMVDQIRRAGPLLRA
jgi:5,10-methylenetetrahydromethanopterin reductase